MRTMPRPTGPDEEPRGGPRRLQLQLLLDRAAPSRARRAVSSLAGEHPRLDDLILATSEVVTNAVRHAGAEEATLHLEASDARVRVAVEHDGDVFHPGDEPRSEIPSGRGLAIVAELVDRWGVDGVDRTLVWFEVGRPD